MVYVAVGRRTIVKKFRCVTRDIKAEFRLIILYIFYNPLLLAARLAQSVSAWDFY